MEPIHSYCNFIGNNILNSLIEELCWWFIVDVLCTLHFILRTTWYRWAKGYEIWRKTRHTANVLTPCIFRDFNKWQHYVKYIMQICYNLRWCTLILIWKNDKNVYGHPYRSNYVFHTLKASVIFIIVVIFSSLRYFTNLILYCTVLICWQCLLHDYSGQSKK